MHDYSQTCEQIKEKTPYLPFFVVSSFTLQTFRDGYICGVSRYRRPSLSRLRSTTASVINSLSSTNPTRRVQTLSSSGFAVRVPPYDLLIGLDDAHDRLHCDGLPRPSMLRPMPLFVQLLAVYILFHLASIVSIVTAQPTTVLFDNCPPTSATEGNPNKRLNITTVYAQIAHWNASSDPTLKMTLLGETGDVLEGYSNTTGYLGT